MKKIGVVALFGLLLLAACDNNGNKPLEPGSKPEIIKTVLPEIWNIQGNRKYEIRVEVNDPQGASNLASVTFEVRTTGGSTVLYGDSLFDDAGWFHPDDGDVVAGDGVFSNRFTAKQFQNPPQTGNLTLTFYALDKNGNAARSQEREIIFAVNAAPQITAVSLPDSFPSGSNEVIFTATVGDSDGIEDVAVVRYESRRAGEQSFLAEGVLFNDGDFTLHGDLFDGDSVFSVRPGPQFAAGKKGSYELRFTVEDLFGESSTQLALTSILVENLPGRIIATAVPDTMHRPSTANTFNRRLLTATVSDPQTLADVDSVYFFSLKPDSTFANSGNPIVLVDNGKPFNVQNPAEESGDETAGDGIYSFSLLVFNDTQPGTYQFTFYMRDRAGQRTEAVHDSITIY